MADVIGDTGEPEATIVGDNLPSQTIATGSQLAGLGEDIVVTVHNPLPNDFRVQYARTLAQPLNVSRERQRSRMRPEDTKALDKAGMDFDKDTVGVDHSVQFLVLKAGETKNLPGDIAQIAVRKLVTYILGQQGKGKAHNQIANPSARADVEDTIVLRVIDNMTLINQMNTSTEDQIADLNKEPVVEPKAPVNPAPGTGMTYDPAKS